MGAEFDGKKISVVGGNAGKGQPPALDVIDPGGRRSRHFIPWAGFSPTDVANAIASLLTDQSGWITGTILNVDDGIMAGRK
jgi:NAD(P)-dependent dehydrogenase (short-subunit alcohol dehydrogenase family)